MTPLLRADCLDALVDSMKEVASTVLAVAFAAHDGESGCAAGHGAYLSLVAEDEAVQVGLLAEPAGCQGLAKLLLGMSADDDDLPAADVSDAMCEIINIVAGGLKQRVSERMRVTMGLPIFVSGHPLPSLQQEVVARSLELGVVPVSLLLLTQKPHAAPVSRRGVGFQTAGHGPAEEQSK